MRSQLQGQKREVSGAGRDRAAAAIAQARTHICRDAPVYPVRRRARPSYRAKSPAIQQTEWRGSLLSAGAGLPLLRIQVVGELVLVADGFRRKSSSFAAALKKRRPPRKNITDPENGPQISSFRHWFGLVGLSKILQRVPKFPPGIQSAL